jgi:SAM-dependent methyltransferase
MDPTFTRQYEAYELRHWWFVARRQIIHDLLDRFVPASARQGRWLDVGCGTGVLLKSYNAFSEKIGTEMDAACVERAREQGIDARTSGIDWDFSALGKFDCISLCDVLEHVEHEQPAIAAVRAALKDDGILLITVPALMSLWSDHDVVNHHFRRYTRQSLLERFPPDQWKVLKVSYFSSFLFPPVWMIRKLKGLKKRLAGSGDRATPPQHDLKFGNPLIDRALLTIFRIERPLLRQASLPVGSSLLLVLRKQNVELGKSPE